MTDITRVPTLDDIYASKDAMDDIQSFTYDDVDTFVDANGVTRDTVVGRLRKMGYTVPVTYAGAIVFAADDYVKTVEESGVIYAPLPSALPFTTSGTFIGDDDARFFVIQGVTKDTVLRTDIKTLASAKIDITISVNTYFIFSDRDDGIFDVITGTGTADGIKIIAHDSLSLSFVLRESKETDPYQLGVVGDNVVDDTAAVKASIEEGKNTVFDVTKTHKITSISLNSSFHMEGANLAFDGLNAGLDIDTIIDGASMKDCTLIGDGVLLSAQKGITSNAALKNASFSNVTIKDFVQGFDLNSAENITFKGGLVQGSVGEASGEGYGIIAGSSLNCTWSGTIYRLCQRHALYLNNAVNQVVSGNIFDKHRDGLATGGGLGALQIAGHSKGVTATGNSFNDCTGPEIVISPQPSNTETMKAISITGNSHIGGLSANIRIGGATPTALENVEGVGISNELFMPNIAYDGSIVQVYNGFSISMNPCVWNVRNGTGTTLIGIALGLTTPDDAFLDDITITGQSGILTKSVGNATFVTIAQEFCVGTAKISIFGNPIETDVYIDYAVTPTNPNIKTDDTTEQALTATAGAINIAGYNNFVVDAAGPVTVTSLANGYEGKIVTFRFATTQVVTFSDPLLYLDGGSFVSTNRDTLVVQKRGTAWFELSRGVNS